MHTYIYAYTHTYTHIHTPEGEAATRIIQDSLTILRYRLHTLTIAIPPRLALIHLRTTLPLFPFPDPPIPLTLPTAGVNVVEQGKE